MAKLHWELAPARVKRRIELEQLRGQFGAMRIAFTSGYDWPPDEVRTPTLDRLRQLEASGDRVMIAQFLVAMSVQITDERRCLNKAQAMRKWATEPNADEVAAVAKVERERLARDRAISGRATEILASGLVKRELAARSRAQKELE